MVLFGDSLGAYLSLLVGQSVPRPASLLIMEHFVSAEIALSDKDRSGFELVFNATRAGSISGVFPIMNEPGLKTGARVVITGALGVRPTVLMDGIIESAEFKPAQSDSAAQLCVRGKDLLFLLDRDEVDREHPAQGPGEIANMVLLPYARYGIAPLVIPPITAERPNPLDRVPMQRATDFAYLSELAQQHDAIFTLIPGPAPLTSVAYWGPVPRLGVPQRAITSDMGPETNVANLSFENAPAEAATVQGNVQDRQTGASVPVRSTVSRRPPLATQPSSAQSSTRQTRLFETNGAPGTAQAMGEAQSQADATSDTVMVKGDIDTGRYGGVLSVRALVGLRGAGIDNDGFYYVQSNVHKIERGSWTQSFALNREGTGTTTPVVMP